MGYNGKLWIKWIHSHYIKHNDVATINTPKQASWLVRKIFTAREWWASDLAVINSFVVDGKYSIKKAYIHAMPSYPKVQWKSLILLPGMMPKH